MIKTFYFNTGVRLYNSSYMGPGDIRNHAGERMIPFDCEDVPDGATFAFGAQVDNLNPDSNYIVRPMFNTTMGSKFAYFIK